MPEALPEWIRLACQQQGDRIREAREHANLTQEKLAEKTELGRSTVQRIEAGSGIKYVHLLVIARALEVPLSELVE
ncbi:helix-turn-helix transcriptional regulator [Streptomyces sp. NPDC006265]|uniref:helix-turn-helix domain-containing protein n=1 Tax=Streptomyces sp. NPDC006265 TaxID=3156740 RepID=UPI0033ADA4FC